MEQNENQGPVRFQPLQRGQVIETSEDDETQSTSLSSFTRQKTDQDPQQSIFPNWDLLPPRTMIRRKDQL